MNEIIEQVFQTGGLNLVLFIWAIGFLLVYPLAIQRDKKRIEKERRQQVALKQQQQAEGIGSDVL